MIDDHPIRFTPLSKSIKKCLMAFSPSAFKSSFHALKMSASYKFRPRSLPTVVRDILSWNTILLGEDCDCEVGSGDILPRAEEEFS